MKDWDQLSDTEKEKLALSSIENFLKMLEGPNDIYKQILLETVFEFLQKGTS